MLQGLQTRQSSSRYRISRPEEVAERCFTGTGIDTRLEGRSGGRYEIRPFIYHVQSWNRVTAVL